MKISEATASQLDWLVAKCRELEVKRGVSGLIYTFDDYGNPHDWNPSSNWAQGGPIIERELIGIAYFPDGWQAQNWQGIHNTQTGNTPLIAAMRCYVASKLGETVSVQAGHFRGDV